MSKLKYFKDDGAFDLRYSTKSSACFDIHACLKQSTKIKFFSDSYGVPYTKEVTKDYIDFNPLERALIPSGLYFDIPAGYMLKIYPRSSISVKFGLNLINNVGIIDEDYVGQLYIAICNMNYHIDEFTNNNAYIKHGDRIAQGQLLRYEQADFQLLSEPPQIKTDRIGGIGSTGK